MLRDTFKAVHASIIGSLSPTLRDSSPRAGDTAASTHVGPAKRVGSNARQTGGGGVLIDGVNLDGDGAGGDGAASPGTVVSTGAATNTGAFSDAPAVTEGSPFQTSNATSHAAVPMTSEAQQSPHETSTEKTTDGTMSVTHVAPTTTPKEVEVGVEQGGDVSPTASHDVATIPRQQWLRFLRRQGTLQHKALNSDAIRPILFDRCYTKVSCSEKISFVS